jgi:hypothetical protein
LGGLLFLQRGERERLESEQEAQRAKQRAEIDSLSSQVLQLAIPLDQASFSQMW